MSLTPDPMLAASEPPAGLDTSPVQQRHSPSALIPAVMALFAFGVGLFLTVFPWTDDWNVNYIQQIWPRIQDVWNQDSFRGAVTGLGLINIYIACLQIARMFRRS